ncbi:MAG: tRNA (guanosine(46)-N7)-methyltransferase TrmB [Alphaproteobacteria bacterium]|nr:MAG: tRNA (guanosine(46)-N7)-methyltransferase TrmB [Alphaproteobacteria bacterium]
MRDLEKIRGSRVYGRRQGPALTKARQARLDEWLPKIEITLSAQGPSAAPESHFDLSLKDHWLEIGFGKGEHLAAQAKTHPDIGMIGCEPFLNGVSGLVDLVDQENLANVRIFTDDARLLMDSLPDRSIGRGFILFPDPWPKARHHKRRMVSAGNIVVLSRILKDGAELRIGTDHMEYCRWIMAHMLENPDFIWISDSPDDWRRRPDDWPASRYEIKSLAQGRKSSYLRFIRRPRST